MKMTAEHKLELLKRVWKGLGPRDKLTLELSDDAWLFGETYAKMKLVACDEDGHLKHVVMYGRSEEQLLENAFKVWKAHGTQPWKRNVSSFEELELQLALREGQ